MHRFIGKVLLVPVVVGACCARALAEGPITLGGATGPTPIEMWMDQNAMAVVWTIVAVSVISAVLFFYILRRAGYNPWLAILMLVPPLGLIPMYMLAFRDWPSQSATRTG
jgi:Zn-dependent protease